MMHRLNKLFHFPTIIYTLITLVAFGASFSPLSAAQEEENIRTTFSGIGWSDTIRDLYYFAEPDKPEKMLIPSGGKSMLYAYSGPPHFFVYHAAVDGEGNQIFVPVGQARFVPGAERHFIIFRQTKKAGAPHSFNLLVDKDDERTFPRGSFRFYNITPHKIVGKLGETTFEVAANQSVVVQPEQSPTNSLVSVFANFVEGDWKLMFKSVWPWREDQRVTVFMVPAQEEGRVTFRLVRERVF